MTETIQPAADAVAKISEYGLAGVCIILVVALVYLMRMMLTVISKTNQIIADSISQSIS